MNPKIVKLFLRLAISLSFLSAVGDRFGLWNENYSVWGNWGNFLDYTKLINPLLPETLIQPIGIVATGAEIIFATCLLIGFKTDIFAKLSGYLLLIFGLAMTFSTGIKGAFDYSVFSASAAAFSIPLIEVKFLELDGFLSK